MPLPRELRRYLRRETQGRLLGGNACAGQRKGLYTSHQLLSYFDAAATRAQTSTAGRSLAERFHLALDDLRLSPYRKGKRRTVDTTHMPQARLNSVDLSDRTLVHAMRLSTLAAIMHRDSKVKLAGRGFRIPVNGKPRNPDKFIQQYRRLKKAERLFRIGQKESVSRGLLWFSDEDSLQHLAGRDIRKGGKSTSVQNAFGLGHVDKETWLVLLRIPGRILQRTGHFRPSFCDGGGKESWFMVAGTASPAPCSLCWGQTCNLEQLHNGAADFDGVVERVAVGVDAASIGEEWLEFELLGPTNSVHTTAAVKEKLSQSVWARRRSP